MLELGIDINAKNGMIFTQLCKYGTEDMIKFAVEMYDADPSLNDNNPILFVSKYQNLSRAGLTRNEMLAIDGIMIKLKERIKNLREALYA